MSQRSWSVQDAKNRFSEVVEAAQRKPQTVTKHGKPAVVIVDVAEYERLRRVERAQARPLPMCCWPYRRMTANSRASKRGRVIPTCDVPGCS